MEFESPKENEEGSQKAETSKRLLLALESVKLNFSKIEIKGEENLSEIPENAKVVIVVDHLNNLSVPTAALVLGHKMPILITNQSTQFPLFGRGHMGVALGGKENFVGLDYDEKTHNPKAFNPENFDSMLGPMKNGYRMVIAAHNPVNSDILPENGGYGAAYLAGIADAYVLPVAVNIKSEKSVHTTEGGAGLIKNIKASIDLVTERPEVEVIIGRPHKISKEKETKRMQELFLKRKSGEKFSKDELEEFKELRRSLDEVSSGIMAEIADMLPEGKRGTWSKDSTT